MHHVCFVASLRRPTGINRSPNHHHLARINPNLSGQLDLQMPQRRSIPSRWDEVAADRAESGWTHPVLRPRTIRKIGQEIPIPPRHRLQETGARQQQQEHQPPTRVISALRPEVRFGGVRQQRRSVASACSIPPASPARLEGGIPPRVIYQAQLLELPIEAVRQVASVPRSVWAAGR